MTATKTTSNVAVSASAEDKVAEIRAPKALATLCRPWESRIDVGNLD